MFSLPDCSIILKHVKYRRLQHKESSIDPAGFIIRFFPKASHEISIANFKCAESTRRLDSGNSRSAPVTGMELHQLSDINVGHAVSVRKHKSLFAKVLPDAANTAASHRFQPRIDQRHSPWLKDTIAISPAAA